MNKLYQTKMDEEFLGLLLKFKNEEKGSVGHQYFEKYNFAYVGEVAERFLNADIISTPERLNTFVFFLFKYSFREDLFQQNQKSTFLRNCLRWIDSNSISNDIEKDITINLIRYIYTHFSIKDTNELNTLNLLYKNLIEKDFSFDFKDVYKLYRAFMVDNNFKNVDKDNSKAILLHILNNHKLSVEEYTLSDLKKMMEGLFTEKDFNILTFLDLQAKHFKKNKENLHFLKSIRQIIFNEFDKFKVQKVKTFINLSEIEILYLNLTLSHFKISRNGTDRVLDLLLNMIMISKEDVSDEIIKYSFEKKGSYYITKMYQNKKDIILNENILRSVLNQITCSYIGNSIIKDILMDENKVKLLSEYQKNTFALYILNNEIKDKESFDKIYKLVDLETIKGDIKENFYYNLFKFGYLNALDLDYLTENKLINQAVEYIGNSRGRTSRYIYSSLIPIEIIKKFKIPFRISDALILLKGEIDFKEEALFFKLTDDENLNNKDYKKLIMTRTLKGIIDCLFFNQSEDAANILTKIVMDSELVEYLDISKEDLLEVQTMLYNSKMISQQSKELLKPVFLSESDLLKEKEDIFLKKLDFYRASSLYYETDSFVDYLNNNFNIIKESKKIQESLISFLFDKMDQKTLRSNWARFTKFYFFVFNSDIVTTFKENLFNVINKTYLTL